MKSIRIISHDDFVKPLVKTLHDTGIMEVEDIRKLDDPSEVLEVQGDTVEAKECSELAVRLEKVVAVLKTSVVAPDGGIKAMLSPPAKPVYSARERPFNELKADVKNVLGRLEQKALDSEKRFSDFEEDLAELEKERENIRLGSGLDFDLSLLHNGGQSEYLLIKMGQTKDPDALRALFKGMDVGLFSRPLDEGGHVALLVFHIDDSEEYRNRVSRDLFLELGCGEHRGKPQAALKEIDERVAATKAREKSLLDQMRSIYGRWEAKLTTLGEEISIELEKLSVHSRLGKTTSTSTIFGWCPVKQEARLKKLVFQTTKGHSMVLSKDPEDDNVPILLRNPRFIRPFETLTEMFASPKYGEVDPTLFIAPLFVIFFGLMLGDAMYGIMVLVAGIVLLKGMGKNSESMRDFGIILSAVGVSTIVLGALQGGFMGPLDVNNPMTALFDIVGFAPMVLVDPMADPIVLLQLALYIGLIHINLGLALGAYQNIHNRRWKDLLHDKISWFIIQPSGALWILTFFGWGEFPQLWMNLATIGLLAGIGLLFIKKGPLAFFDITGFIGNWLSYARLLALGLATAGIAMTINIILGMIMAIELNWLCCSTVAVVAIALLAVGVTKKNSVMKILSLIMLPIAIIGLFSPVIAFAIVGGIIFVSVHIGNAVLQALGAFIHSLRLQYVEFFGQFYEGGGRKFDPFKLTREFTVLKEADK